MTRGVEPVRKGLAVDRLVSHVSIDTFDRHAEQFGILDLFCALTDQFDKGFTGAGNATASPSFSIVSAVASSTIPL